MSYQIQKPFFHAFHLIEGITPSSLRRIYGYFGDFSNAWICGTEDDFIEAGLTSSLCQKIEMGKLTIDPMQAHEKLERDGFFLDFIRDTSYPRILATIPDAPIGIYRRGPPPDGGLPVAVVGSRSASSYGMNVARNLGKRLALCGATVVSGLAFGIDAAAHEAAVQAEARTIAVLASGINRITPSSNAVLAQKILASGGTIYSEYPTDGSSYKGRFLERNRIISGLSKATVVVEAKVQSGALTTAQYALEQDRALWAVPGDIDRPQAAGCLKLIADGQARALTDIGPFIQELGLDEHEAARGRLSSAQKKILLLLRSGPHSFDFLLHGTGLPADQMNTQITLLELQKMVTKNQQGEWTAA